MNTTLNNEVDSSPSFFSTIGLAPKVALGMFILGKIQGIITIAFLFAGDRHAVHSLVLYACLIFGCLALCIYDQGVTSPKKEKQEVLQKDYDLLLEKYNKLVAVEK